MKITYTCDTHSGPKTVTGTAYHEAPGLAIHRNDPAGWWRVSHTASGLMLAMFERRRQARSFLLAIAPVLDWTQDGAAIEAAYPHDGDISKRLRAMAREHGRIKI